MDLCDYIPIPGQDTVIHHPPYNQHFRCLICIKCGRAVNCSNLLDHVRREIPYIDIPEDLPAVLEAAYNLVPYSTVVYTPGAIQPIFGIALNSQPLFICECGIGFSTYEALRPHQTRVGEGRECPLRLKKPTFHKGYGQRLSNNRSFFEVDPTSWKHVSDFSEYPLAFFQSLPPLRDYSKIGIKGAVDEMNTSSFFYSQRWLSHLEGYSAEDISEVIRDTTDEAPYGVRLRQVAETFLLKANTELKNHNTFGLPKLMAQTTERETLHRFESVQDKTVKKYALTLHRLVFGVIRQLDASYSHAYRYPALHSTQIEPLEALKAGIIAEMSMNDLIKLFQSACFKLFAHHQHEYETSRDANQFFSPVICFLVLSSMREQGGFQFPTVITGYIAHIMFAIRSVMLFEVIKKSKRDKIGLSE